MPTHRPALEVTARMMTSARRIAFSASALVVAGWTGRDPVTVGEHFDELAVLGVSRPASVPVFYRLAASLLTQEDEIEVLGSASSGEAEAVIVACDGELWLGVGSDHTDRSLEAIRIAASKQVCAKPLGREVLLLAEFIDHWDKLILRSYLGASGQRELYQDGRLGANLSAITLIERYTGGRSLAEGSVMFCGTLPIRGPFRRSTQFSAELVDPVLGRNLQLGYAVRELPDGESEKREAQGSPA